MIFIDADAFIGFVSPKDAHHEHAKKLFEKIKDTDESFVTSWDVVDEAITKISYQVGKANAQKFLEFLGTSKINIEYPSPAFFSSVMGVFTHQTSAHISWTDCVNMVIAKNLGITTFFSFDHHYEQNGFQLLK
jgi:uncharacterized protein